MAFALTGAAVFDGDAIRSGLAVVIGAGRIVTLIAESAIEAGVEIRRLAGGLLAPGFIDVQVNGGGGALLNDQPSVAVVRRIAAAHRAFGTTGLLPTVMTDDRKVTAEAIAAVRAARAEPVPGVLGIHVEGPFIDPLRKGAHDQRFIRVMTESDVAALAAADCGIVMLTAAPNRVTPQMIRQLTAAGILVSLGHAEATASEAEAAIAAGASAFTHLYNAMSPLAAREAGMTGAALAAYDCYVSVIADGHHVSATSLKAALAAKGADRVMLISDAMPSAAGGPSNFKLQGRPVTLANGRLQLADGTLAGSNLTMDAALRHCVREIGVPLEAALQMASRTPADFLGLSHAYGRIAPGYQASLVHLSDDLLVRQTWIDGED